MKLIRYERDDREYRTCAHIWTEERNKERNEEEMKKRDKRDR
jgi:hypothetical protein